MQIHRLRLSGFKSFVEPAELFIEPGLTGIVGPNGCGKSNLLEAIRWVMGETSAKSMRSGGMEDVIFAGTESRPERAFAEVVLHARDDEGEDIVVTRRIDRGAGSAYRVNGDDVRAKDVALTFADAATGAHSPALVSQGKIAQVIAAKPAQRRMVLEEAAGIAGLHVRRRDAESKLRSTEANLARLDDLMAGLDSQIATLKRQARQAERYRQLTNDIESAEAQLVFARWRDAAEAANKARLAAQEAETRVAALQEAASEAEAAQEKTAQTLASARQNLTAQREEALAQNHRLEALQDKLEASETRLADLTAQRRRLEEDREAADALTRDAVEALTRLEANIDQSKQSLDALEAERPQLEERRSAAEQASRKAEIALAKANADQAGIEADWRVANAAIEQSAFRLNRLEQEAQNIADTRAALERDDDAGARIEEARKEHDERFAAVARLREALEKAQDEKTAATAKHDEAAEAFANARTDLLAVSREFQALDKDKQARAKRAQSRENQTLALDAIEAEPGYERAVAAVLGRDAKTPLGAPKPSNEGRFWAGNIADDPAALDDALIHHVTQCPAQLKARLALVRVAASDDGRALAPGEWLVTLAGELRRWDGFVARGEGAGQAAQLEADNRHKELETKLPALKAAAAAAEEADEAAKHTLQRLREELVEKDRALAAGIEAERQSARDLDAAQAAKERIKARMEELASAEAARRDELEQARKQAQSDKAKLADLPPPDAGRTALEASHAAYEAARASHQEAMALISSHAQSLAVARERLAAVQSERASWKSRSGEAEQRLEQSAKRLAQIEEESAIIAAKPAALRDEIAAAQALHTANEAKLTGAANELSAAEASASQAQQALGKARELLATAREERASLAERAQSEETRRTEMGRISGERFQCPPPLLPQRFSFAEDAIERAADQSEALDKLTAARERIGPVNLVASDDLARVEEEQAASTHEQAELTEAVARLRGSIGSLNREGRERFRAAFETVDRDFRILFERLFQGGKAHLALVESDDPLEAGLEIYAQPPGKRLQSLSLLSGGEQALTATALIFALFLTKPSPICVLDEVDAPLDDANVERFCDLLDTMVETTDTRYLIVTHNAVTMSRMHRLFGVTMIERGISRLVSVDLGEAEKLAAE